MNLGLLNSFKSGCVFLENVFKEDQISTANCMASTACGPKLLSEILVDFVPDVLALFLFSQKPLFPGFNHLETILALEQQ